MFVIDDAKLPPPTPASAVTTSSVPSETPGFRTANAVTMGMSSSSALMTVQLRPPNFATANVYGSRSTDPTSAGTVVSRNLSSGAKPYAGPRNRTSTDHIVQTEKPMCSDRMEKTRLRRATCAPPLFQNPRSSGRQSSIQCDRFAGASPVSGTGTAVVSMAVMRLLRGCGVAADARDGG